MNANLINEGWIPVEKLLPEKEGYYRVMFIDGTEDEKPFRIRPRKNIYGFMSMTPITHWKPLSDGGNWQKQDEEASKKIESFLINMDNSELRKSLTKQIIETTKNFGENTPNELLQIIEFFGFLDYNNNLWSFDIRNSSNCECRVFLYLLADNKTVRVSIGDYMCSRLDNPVDLFETVDYERINNFISYLL